MATTTRQVPRPPRGLRPAPGVAPLLLAMAIWGSTLVVTRGVLDDVGPLTILLLRAATAFAVLWPWARRQGFTLRMALKPAFIAFGLTGVVLHLGLENIGLMFTSASSAALIVAGIPAVTAVLGVWFLGERLDRAQTAGIALSITGVILVTGASIGELGMRSLVGDLLVFGGVVMWGVYTVQGKRLSVGHPAIVSTAASTAAALWMLIPISAVEIAVSGAPNFTPSAIAGIVYLGVGASAAAYALWNHALSRVDATVAAPFVNLTPVVTLILAVLIGEHVTALQLAGGAVVIGGVLLGTIFGGRSGADRVPRTFDGAHDRIPVDAGLVVVD